MRKITKEDLTSIIENHQKWLNKEGGIRANLRGANLRFANLRGANLSDAILSGSNLFGANLRGADLSDANLRGAILSGSNLSDAILSGSNLFGANLRGANLRGANLSDAILSGSSLSDAILIGADLRNAILIGADSRYAKLSDAKNIPFIPLSCPETGSFIGYKKASGYIVKLKILEDSKRSSSTSRKCRCDKAKVLAIENLDGSISDMTCVHSDYDNSFKYTIGKIVKVSDFCEDRWRECSAGIHFFISRQEAVDYNF